MASCMSIICAILIPVIFFINILFVAFNFLTGFVLARRCLHPQRRLMLQLRILVMRFLNFVGIFAWIDLRVVRHFKLTRTTKRTQKG